jgi:hypothetical protein
MHIIAAPQSPQPHPQIRPPFHDSPPADRTAIPIEFKGGSAVHPCWAGHRTGLPEVSKGALRTVRVQI